MVLHELLPNAIYVCYSNQDVKGWRQEQTKESYPAKNTATPMA